MEGLKTLSEYAELVRTNKNNPHELAGLHIEIAAKFAFLSDVAKDLQLEKAIYWQVKFAKDKPLSDVHLEANWRLTEGGGKELRMKHEMRGLTALMGAIKTSSVVTSIEARNIL